MTPRQKDQAFADGQRAKYRDASTGRGIYAILRKGSSDKYVGSAVSLGRRWASHRAALKKGDHHSKRMQAVFNKYGADLLEYVVLERVEEKEQLLEREQHWLDALQPTYNTAKIAGSCLGVKLAPRSAEYLAKASASRMGKKRGPHSEEHRAALSAAHKGKQFTAEHRAKLSAANKGKKPSDAARAAMSRAGLGRKRSPITDEARANMSAAQVGKKRPPRTDEARANMAAAQIGKKHSEATRQAMRDAWVRRRANQEVRCG